MKKFVTFLLIATLLLTAIPAGQAMADIKLSNTTLELTEGDTFSLQSNTDSKNDIVIWNTTNKNVATVTADGVVTAVNVGKAKITARVSKKKYVCKVTVVKSIVNIRPSDAGNFVNESILGQGFYVLGNYIHTGSSSYGEDFETTLKNLDANMAKLSEYNDSVNKFEGEEYDDLKAAWNNLYTEITSLYKNIKDNPPKINDKGYKLDTDNALKYLNTYFDECKYFE